jgi:hypothetical protein
MKNVILPNLRPSAGSQLVRLVREGALPALRLLARPSTLTQIPRLFGEGLAPARRMLIQAHNNREMARLIQEGTPITYVCSFGRSGNTWMRHLLCDILLQNQGIQTTTELPIGPGKIVPDYHTDLIARRDASVQTAGCLVKIHDTIPTLQKRIGGDPAVRQCRYLYLYRTPEDALVSVFHLYLREKYIHSKSGKDVDLFCLEFLSGWIKNVNSYLVDLNEGVDIHLVSYEQLLDDTTTVLSRALGWLGIPYTEATVSRADSNMKFGKLQAMEAKTLEGKIPFFRRGCSGAGSLELKPDTLSKIRDATQHLISRADEMLALQVSRNQTVREKPAPPFTDKADCRNASAKAIPACNGC